MMLSELLYSKGINQIELAREAKISATTVNQFLLHNRVPRPKTLKALIDALSARGVNPDEIQTIAEFQPYLENLDRPVNLPSDDWQAESSSLWAVQNLALEKVEAENKPEALKVHLAFSRVYNSTRELFKATKTINQEVARACLVLVMQARDYALSCYNLILNGLEHPAAIMANKFRHTLELLLYLQHDLRRTELAYRGTLPDQRELPERHSKKIAQYHQLWEASFPETLTDTPETIATLLQRTPTYHRNKQLYDHFFVPVYMSAIADYVAYLADIAEECLFKINRLDGKLSASIQLFLGDLEMQQDWSYEPIMKEIKRYELVT